MQSTDWNFLFFYSAGTEIGRLFIPIFALDASSFSNCTFVVAESRVWSDILRWFQRFIFEFISLLSYGGAQFSPHDLMTNNVIYRNFLRWRRVTANNHLRVFLFLRWVVRDLFSGEIIVCIATKWCSLSLGTAVFVYRHYIWNFLFVDCDGGRKHVDSLERSGFSWLSLVPVGSRHAIHCDVFGCQWCFMFKYPLARNRLWLLEYCTIIVQFVLHSSFLHLNMSPAL